MAVLSGRRQPVSAERRQGRGSRSLSEKPIPRNRARNEPCGRPVHRGFGGHHFELTEPSRTKPVRIAAIRTMPASRTSRVLNPPAPKAA